jgi:hypothetical protein
VPVLGLLCLAGLTGLAVAADQIELNYRLQPGQDLVAETTSEVVTDLRVKEDRGLLAQARARGIRFPLTMHLVNRQVLRYRTGEPAPDGSFSVELTQLEKTSVVRLPDGQEQAVPDGSGIQGFRMTAFVEPGGQLRHGSLAVHGVEGPAAEVARSVMGSVLQQAAGIEPVTLRLGQATPQDLRMQVPIPGLATLDMNMTISNRLIGVADGVATVEMVYHMDFDTPGDGPMKIRADGAGGGRLLYEVATRIARQTESNSVMNFEGDTPEGVIEVRMSSSESQHMRQAAAAPKD